MSSAGRLVTAICIAIVAVSGCTGSRERQWSDVPWSVASPELSLRLIVPQKMVQSGLRPSCIMEIMNTSRETILVDKSFSLNGPTVRSSMGRAMPQIEAAEVKEHEGKSKYHRLAPGEVLSVRAKPNYEMTDPGGYVMSFSIHPTWWGVEDTETPGKLVPNDGTGEGILVSNEVEVKVY